MQIAGSDYFISRADLRLLGAQIRDQDVKSSALGHFIAGDSACDKESGESTSDQPQHGGVEGCILKLALASCLQELNLEGAFRSRRAAEQRQRRDR